MTTPDTTLLAKEAFAIDCDWSIPCFSNKTPLVPSCDTQYRFNQAVTSAILAGFLHNKRVLVWGMHGTGKSTHIEQVAARLRWPCMRVNLDGHISRLDLVGRDAVVLRDNKQVTEFQEGIIPWAMQRPMALIFDEYDAGRADVMFVIQRLLERDGSFTLLDKNTTIEVHPSFRLFATANTIGLGNSTGLYHGAQRLNQAQLDRWNIIATLDYVTPDEECAIVFANVPKMDTQEGRAITAKMVAVANLTRVGFAQGDISTVMSPRTVIVWAENYQIFKNLSDAFCVSFFNRCDIAERPVIAEYFQRCFASELEGTYFPLHTRFE